MPPPTMMASGPTKNAVMYTSSEITRFLDVKLGSLPCAMQGVALGNIGCAIMLANIFADYSLLSPQLKVLPSFFCVVSSCALLLYWAKCLMYPGNVIRDDLQDPHAISTFGSQVGPNSALPLTLVLNLAPNPFRNPNPNHKPNPNPNPNPNRPLTRKAMSLCLISAYAQKHSPDSPLGLPLGLLGSATQNAAMVWFFYRCIVKRVLPEPFWNAAVHR